jgi:hypothetical protein
MPFVPFHDYFPELAEQETRSITVLPNSDLGLPAGEYGFMEMYCDEPGCDCRRVFFYVVCSFRKGVQAVVAWGWEDLDFYRRWFKYGDPALAVDLKGPILNWGSSATELAPALLALVRNVLLKDAEYVERIKRHYTMFREKIDKPRRPTRRKPKKHR